MNQKGFTNIILVVVIAILVGAVGYFVFVQKSDLTTQHMTTSKDQIFSWKTYRNEEHGFEVRYPNSAKMEIGTETVNWSLKDNNMEEGDFNFQINVYEKTRVPLEVYQRVQDDWESYFSCPKVIVANVEAFRCIIEGPPELNDANNIQYHFKREGVYYNITTMYRGNGKDDGVGDQILSTFKFTK